MKAYVRATQYSIQAEVGPLSEDGVSHVFGDTAEVYASEGIAGKVVAEVSFAAIGSHSPERARVRADSYLAAIRLAEIINRSLAKGMTLVQAADVLPGVIDGVDIEVLAR